MAFSQYEIQRTLMEVYKTDEENWEQYTPNMGDTAEDNTNDSTDEEDSEDTTEEEDDTSLTKGFSLHQGEILETYYYGNSQVLIMMGTMKTLVTLPQLKSQK